MRGPIGHTGKVQTVKFLHKVAHNSKVCRRYCPAKDFCRAQEGAVILFSVTRTLHVLIAVNLKSELPEMDQASFCNVLRVPGMNYAALCDHCAIQFLPFST